MSQPVELVPMYCLKCQTPVPAKVEETVWVCSACGQGMLLDSDKGLVAQEIHTSTGTPGTGAQGVPGHPYWVATGRVSLNRSTFSGDQTREMLAFWAQPRRFIIPAYALELEEITRMGVNLVRQSPVLTPAASTATFKPVVLMPEDLRPLAEFIILSIEAERKDSLKELTFTLDLEPPELWILP
jgi:hypothetical protein